MSEVHKKFRSVLPTIEDLGGTQRFAEMADGTRIRVAEFPAKAAAAGTVLLFPGFTEFVEKHLETVADLQKRGYRVVTLDWRGQGLSDRTLADRHKGHIGEMQFFLNDVEELLDVCRFAEMPRPHILIGHSMGGHLALRAAHDHPGLFFRIVLLAPMADILTGWLPRLLAPLVAGAAVRGGLGKRYVFGLGPYGERQRRFEGNPLTRDEDRFRHTHAQIDREPALAIGGPTFGWVDSALRSIRLVNRPGYLGRISVPVLLLSAEEEKIVSNEGQRRLAAMLPDCRLVSVAGARHELMMERDEIRIRVWAEIDGFLAAAD